VHEVYTSAERVFIWLGNGQERTSETFEFLKEILDLENFDELVSNPIPNARKWANVIDMMKNRWFSSK
jgi:hypothetical protein